MSLNLVNNIFFGNEILNDDLGAFKSLPNELISEIVKNLNNDFDSLKNLELTSRYFRQMIYNCRLNNTSLYANNKFICFLHQLNKSNNLYNSTSSINSSKFNTNLIYFFNFIKCPTIDLTSEKNLAIKKACKYGYTEIVKTLLQNGIDPATNNNYAIKKASENGYAEIVKILLETQKVDPSASKIYNYGIKKALKKGISAEYLKLYLPSIFASGSNYAIKKASQKGHLEVVKLLLDSEKVDSSAENNYAIKQALKNGHVKVVRLLLADERIDLNDLINYPF